MKMFVKGVVDERIAF
jgi:hypothetical protein